MAWSYLEFVARLEERTDALRPRDTKLAAEVDEYLEAFDRVGVPLLASIGSPGCGTEVISALSNASQ